MEILNEKEPEFIINRDKLKRLLSKVVQASRGFNVEKLQRLYSVLSQTIYNHSRDYDKTRMLSVSNAAWRDYDKTRLLSVSNAAWRDYDKTRMLSVSNAAWRDYDKTRMLSVSNAAWRDYDKTRMLSVSNAAWRDWQDPHAFCK